MLQTYKACFASKFQGKTYQLSSKCPRPKQKKRRSEKKEKKKNNYYYGINSVTIFLKFYIFMPKVSGFKNEVERSFRNSQIHFRGKIAKFKELKLWKHFSYRQKF